MKRVSTIWLAAGLLAGCTGDVHSNSPAAALHAAEPMDVRMADPPGEGAAAQWPGWRGPSRQGKVSGSGYPDRWSDQQNVIWRTEVPGEGHSSPVIWDERLFLTTSYDGGDRRTVLCYRRSDGELLWETEVPHETRPERKYRKNSYASGTPATDGERVYAYFGNHGLVAIDFDGNVVWHDPIGEMSNIFHGAGGSPVLYEDKLIMFQENQSPVGSFVAAWDRQTGERLWWTEREERVGWGSPIVIQANGRAELIVSSSSYVRAYDPQTGEPLWYCGGNMFEVTPTPVVGEGLVFASSGRAGPTLAIRPGGSGDVTSTHLVWQEQRRSPFIPSPLLYDGLLYTVNDMAGELACYDPQTGELLYREQLADDIPREGISASPVGVDGQVFVTADDGRTFVVRAGSQFELLHVNRFQDRTLASPALLDGRWYWRTARHLLAIGH